MQTRQPKKEANMPLHIHGTRFSVNALITSRAAHIARPQVVRFKQGILSPGAYIDNRKLPSHPTQHDTVLAELGSIVRQLVKDEKYALLASVATGGIAHAAVVAWKMGLPHVVVRLTGKDHGMGGQIDGDPSILRGASVFLFEDMSSTFQSCIDAIKLLQEAGACVKATLLISTWNFPAFKRNIEEYRVYALCTGKMILDRMVELGRVDRAHEQIVRHWLEHPEDSSWVDSSWQIPVEKPAA